ncbi:hypothetical protein N9341_01110 [Candidatus Pelagibacter sp.]|jgi:hypothetical protein|nr:hypothetical protein [Candidatus Pelagibacter sp.]
MIKSFFILFLFLFLTNCAPPGAAFLGPALTGASTKSIARTGLSYGSSHLVKKTKEQLEIIKETKTAVYQKVGQMNKKIHKNRFNNVVLKDNDQRDLFFKAVKNNLKKYN